MSNKPPVPPPQNIVRDQRGNFDQKSLEEKAGVVISNSGNLGFSNQKVKKLTAQDFRHKSRELITLHNDSDCISVLFMVNNKESRSLASLWGLCANETASNFAYCNLSTEKVINEAFEDLHSDPDHPLYWVSVSGRPFILVYRSGWPQAFYNGELSLQAVSNFILMSACRAGFQDRKARDVGVKVEKEKNAVLPPPISIQKEIKSSSDFSTANRQRVSSGALPVEFGSAAFQDQVNNYNKQGQMLNSQNIPSNFQQRSPNGQILNQNPLNSNINPPSSPRKP